MKTKMITQKLIFVMLYFYQLSATNISYTPYTEYFKLGEEINLRCKIQNLTVTWTGPPKNDIYAVGMEVDINRKSEISVKMEHKISILTIFKFAKEYEGVYKCFDDETGTLYNVTKRLDPTDMIIANKDDNGLIKVNENAEILLECSITQGQPLSLLKWSHDKTMMVSNGTSILKLPLKPSMDDHGSIYTCEAIDDANETLLSESVKLLVCGRPFKPTSLTFEPSSTDVKISWIPGYNGCYELTFEVEYRKYDEKTWMSIETVDENEIFLEDLYPWTQYVIRMYAYNKINRSEYTEETNVRTKEKEEHENSPSTIGYYAFLSIPGLVIIFLLVYFILRAKDLICRVTSCLKRGEENQQEQNGIVNFGPGAIADMYGHPPNLPPREQNNEVQVYSSFDRRHNITLSSHAHAVSYDVRPKPRTDRTRIKKAKAKQNDQPSTKTTGQNSASGIETQEPHELNYVEVTFDPKTEANELRIHGHQPKTDYIDIDFTKKLRNLPKPKDDDDSDDDFETAYEVNKMKRKTKLQE